MSEKIEPVAWSVDLDGTGSLHMCAKGDPGAVELYDSTTVSALEAEIKRLRAALESVAWTRGPGPMPSRVPGAVVQEMERIAINALTGVTQP